jgi:multiple sugar transport system permease protein
MGATIETSSAGQKIRQRRRGFHIPTYGWYLLPFLVVTTIIVLVPLAYSLFLSFHRYNLSEPYRGLSFIGFTNYVTILHDPYVLASLKISLEYVFASIAGELLIGFALMLLLSQRLRGLRVFQWLLIMPLMLTPSTVGLVWRFFYGYTGQVNYMLELVGLSPVDWFSSGKALLSVIITSVWQNYPFAFLVLFAGVQTIPSTLIEAAQIDGASPWQIFSRITLPLISTFIIIILVIRTTNILRYVDLIFTLTFGGPGRATETLSFLIYTNAFSFFDMGYGSALSFLLIGLSVVITWGYMRYMKGE